MVTRGISHGRLIQCADPLPFADGQEVQVTVEAIGEAVPGSPSALLQALSTAPRVDPTAVDEMERIIRSAAKPIRLTGVFDEDGES